MLIQSLQGESEHRRPKQSYIRVRKGKHTQGITKEVLRERVVHLAKSRAATQQKIPKLRGRKRISEVLPPTSPTAHHHISTETREKVDIAQYLDDNEDDPAVEVCTSFSDSQLTEIDVGLLSSAPRSSSYSSA